MSSRPLVTHVTGARPNYMKIAPIYTALDARSNLNQALIHTGQHYDPALRDAFFSELPLPEPTIDLEIGSGRHGEQTARALTGLEQAFLDLRPDLVVVAGDVNSTLAGALAAVKLEIPVCHVEAGLRSFDWSMPEEHNRRLTDHVSTLLLTHSESANENLAAEGIPGSRIAFVGNTMIDSLLECLETARRLEAWRDLGLERGGYLLVTLHRPTLVDSRELLTKTLAALEIVSGTIPVVFPMHPRTRTRLEEYSLELPSGILATPPLPYHAFVSLEADAAAVVTDSGGVQEETTALGVRCFTLRENTERPVTVTQGTNVLLGLDPGRLRELPELLRSPSTPVRQPPLWDGHAGARAAEAIERLLLGEATARATG
jgi:UDP-N-acetylglucosamine 2-epimerase (non-hydrolysing)